MGSAASGLAAVMIFMVRKLRQQIKHKRIQPLMWKMSLENARRGNKSVRNMRAATTTSVERSQVKKITSVDSSANGATIHEKYCFELLLPREFALTETVQGVKEAIEQCRSVPSEEQTLFLIESPGRYHQADLCEGPSSPKIASRSVRCALLMPQPNPGSLNGCGKSMLRAVFWATTGGKGPETPPPQTKRLCSRRAGSTSRRRRSASRAWRSGRCACWTGRSATTST